MVAQVYRARKPKASPLWQCLIRHFDRFQAVYEERYQSRHGYLRPIIPEVVNKFMDCGDLERGFARDNCRLKYRMLVKIFNYRSSSINDEPNEDSGGSGFTACNHDGGNLVGFLQKIPDSVFREKLPVLNEFNPEDCFVGLFHYNGKLCDKLCLETSSAGGSVICGDRTC
jgi:hypothetical protein